MSFQDFHPIWCEVDESHGRIAATRKVLRIPDGVEVPACHLCWSEIVMQSHGGATSDGTTPRHAGRPRSERDAEIVEPPAIENHAHG